MAKFSNIQFENFTSNYIPSSPIPKKIAEYYISHGYMERNIPLNADTCREIAKILDEGGD